MNGETFNTVGDLAKANEAQVNLAVIGDPKSGKTALVESFLTEKFLQESSDTVLRVTKTRLKAKQCMLDVNIFDLSGYISRDRDLVGDYLKSAEIILICHSFEDEFNEEQVHKWITFIEQRSNDFPEKNIYLVGCKYDMKVRSDYQMGSRVTSLMYANENLTSFGERIKTFVNQPHNNVKSYFLTSALLNFNVKETFFAVMKDFLIKHLGNRTEANDKDNQNCYIF